MKTLKDIICEKLVINKDSQLKHTFYEFTKFPEGNKILTICGFNNSDNKPDKEMITAIREALFDIKQKLNEEIYALVNQDTYNLLNKKYNIKQYKNFIIIDDQNYDKFYDDRFNYIVNDYTITADYHIYAYDYFNNEKYEDNKILYCDTRNPDENISIFFIKKQIK